MGEFEGPIDAAARRSAVLEDGWANAALSVLDDALANRTWLVGDRFSVADINVSVMMVRPALVAVGLAEFAHVSAWWNRCVVRPAFERMRQR